MERSFQKPIFDRSVIVPAKNQVSSNHKDEKVVLLLDTGMYYSLNPVGSYIWDLIQESRSVGDLRTAVLERYDVPRERCDNGLLGFLRELVVEGLIEIREEATS